MFFGFADEEVIVPGFVDFVFGGVLVEFLDLVEVEDFKFVK